MLDTNSMLWINLSNPTVGNPPHPRDCLGLTVDGRKLYVFGGVHSHIGEIFVQVTKIQV